MLKSTWCGLPTFGWMRDNVMASALPWSYVLGEWQELLAEVRAANQEARVYKLEDVNKGWYRLSTERAMQIVAEEWRDPAAGKEKLVKRFESSQKQVSFE